MHRTRKALHDVSHLPFKAHLEITNTLRREDWDSMDRIMAAKITSLPTRVTAKPHGPFERVCGSQRKTEESLSRKKVVMSLSSKTFDEHTLSLLAKGLNSTIAPCAISVKKSSAG